LLGMTGGLYMAPEKTMYRHIYRLPAAHTLVVKKTRMTITRYWDLDAHKETRYASSGQYVEAFREKFTEAIQCRLRSNYDVGCELSGGLDSSGITCIAANLLHQQNKPISTYSYTLPDGARRQGVAKHTEDAFADEVCAYAKVDNPVKIYTSGYKNFLEELDLALFIGDGPDTSAQVWNWPVKKIAGIYKTRVLLSGYPGDELVTNYSPMQYLEFCRMQTLLKYFKTARSEASLKEALKTLLLSKLSKPVKLVFKNYLLNNSVESFRRSKYNYLSDDCFNEVKHYIPIMHEWPGSYRELQKSLICDPIRAQRLESEIQNGKMNKVVTCFPMADIRLMEFVLSVPVTEKASPQADRWLFRRGLEGYMPSSIVSRKDKTGAVLPFVELEWVARQQQVKSWTMNFDPAGQKLPFFNYSKFLSRYNWQISDDADYRSWIQPSRNKQVESIIRWYEVNN
jgi:asparagine synthase (glutamine-hydrolysing)